ncbi:aminotransferase class I and II protein [Coleophoma cylindrospora]|uniref:Aminotransferase class I and II protein n=1 Tax=Coleophoma cylindrospora TaxID=1849047 RepID=A0A3D8S7F1_9HELO|nr:aminotransferase class I and II protein [Coleophoma cylindrospora]
MDKRAKLQPAARVAGRKQDVWSIVNEAAAASPIQPIVNLGQGFFGYNPPHFIIEAAKEALNRVDANQYSPTKGRPRLKKAIADSYSPLWGRQINPETEVTITTGANEGMLSAFMGFIEDGDEVIIFEPFFDQYISNIEMPGGKIVYVPLHPPPNGGVKNSSAGEWTIDFAELEKAISPRTKMIVLNTPHNPIGKVFSKDELLKIGELCVKNNIIILSDEVYDRLFYTPFTRIATLSPEIERLTLTVGSAGKNFYATGWRVGWLIGPADLIQYVAAAHTRICYSSVSPLQEAAAVGFEQADANNFWETAKKDMKGKMDRFNEVWKELDLPFSDPEGGYFVLVNMKKVKLPADYPFPDQVKDRPRDFKLCWFLIQEVGVAAIPPTEFYTDANAHIGADWMRFAVCKEDDILEQAKERLRGLKKYIE